MTGLTQPQKIPTQLLIVFVFFSFILCVAGFMQFRTNEKKFMNSKYLELSAISDLKVKQIVNWRNERIADGKALSGNQFLVQSVQTFLNGQKTENGSQGILKWMESIRINEHYSSVHLLDRQGRLLLSMPEKDKEVLTSQSKRMALEAMQDQKIVLSELYTNRIDNSECMSLFAPVVLAKGSKKEVIGTLVLCINASHFLFPFLQQWPLPSNTSESFLVRREGNQVVVLNQLRFRKDSALSLRMPIYFSDASMMTVEQSKGLTEGIDYRGTPVFAFIKRIPGTNWSLIAKVDKEEVLMPFWEQTLISTTLIGILIIFTGTLVVLIWRQQQACFYREKYEVEVRHQSLLKRFEYLTMYANDIIILFDSALKIIEVNERAVLTYGYSREEWVDKTIHHLRAEGTLPKLCDIFESSGTMANGITYETVHVKKNGSPFPIEVSIREIMIDGIQIYQAIIRDISERKRFEKEMARLDQLNLIGQMAASIGHEIRNPMTTVRGFLQLFSEKAGFKDNQQHFYLMIEELDRANLIITEFLSLSRDRAIDLRKRNLSDIIRKILPLIQADANKMGNSIITHLNPVEDLYLDEKEIRQIILNLVRNGLEAMPQGGVLKLNTYMSENEVVLSVEDHGTGIAPETLDQIGTPFFTTKENGTGLGLAVCYSIADRHNARIKVETSSLGTSFFVTFRMPEDRSSPSEIAV